MQPKIGLEGARFSGVTCQECRGTLREPEHENLEPFECRVGLRYSFASLLEQHAIATERVLWAAVLALEEEMQLARLAGQRTSTPEARQIFEEKTLSKEKQATLLREMLTRPDPAFQRQPSPGHSSTDRK